MNHEVLSTRSIDRVETAFADVDTTVIPKRRYEREELISRIGEARGLFVHSENTFDDVVIDRAPNLEAIAKPGSGIDNIDLDAATEAGVVVLHTPGMNAVAVAEFTIGAILTRLRRLPEAQDRLVEGGWRSQDWWGTELRGKTVGIVGLGAAGMETAKRLDPFCEEFLVHDPYVDDDRVAAIGGESVSLEEVLSASDLVSLHVRLTPETRGMIGAEELATLGPDSYLVNTSRGPVVEREALVEALDSGTIAGAVLDVFHEEPPDADDPVLDQDTALTTPHLAGATTETRTRMLNVAAENLVAVLDGRDVPTEYVANPSVL